MYTYRQDAQNSGFIRRSLFVAQTAKVIDRAGKAYTSVCDPNARINPDVPRSAPSNSRSRPTARRHRGARGQPEALSD